MYNIQELSGWYYDIQLKNRLIAATLHPNRILEGKNWVPIKDPFPEYKDSYSDNNKQVSTAYSQTPICNAILSEDFNVSVANSWSDFGGDMLGQMWESIKPLAPYASAFQTGLSKAVADYDNLLQSKDSKSVGMAKRIKESKLSSTLAGLMRYVNNAVNNPESGIDITDYLNRALVVQGTRFSYYSGSGTSFGNLVMKFTVFPTYNESGRFVTVDEQVEKLFPYCIGKFVSGTDGLISDENKKEEGSIGKLIDNMVSWQKPPGGFKATVKNVDVVQEGTLLLKFGAYYRIDNLVVENATFNFSKQMTKNPMGYDGTGNGKIISPLYCEVTIQLKPATKYSDDSLKRFVLGNSRESDETIKLVNDNLRNKLSGEINDI